MKRLTAKQVQDITGNTVSVRKGSFTVRKGFYYRMGMDQNKLADQVAERMVAAGHTIIIEDTGEKFVAFRGGDTVAQGSHFWVKFKIVE